MFKNPPFVNFHPFPKLLVFAGISAISLVIFLFVGLIIKELVFQIEITNPDQTNVSALKVMQIFTTTGLFLTPPILLAFLASKNRKEFLGLKNPTSWQSLAIMPILVISALPLINWMAEINGQMQFPASLEWLEIWMRESEDRAMKLVEKFVQMKTVTDLFYNLFVIAVLPALGEELFFRGVIQKQVAKWANNPHIGIWVAAICFSAIHMQFYGFLPRMVMGATFGYLFLWSKSLWLPILAHFSNNAASIIVSFFIQKGYLNEETENLGSDGIAFPLVSLLLCVGLLWVTKKMNKPVSHVSDSFL